MDKVRAELRAANLNTAELATKLKEKESLLRSYAKKMVDLKRKVLQLGRKLRD